MVRPFSLRVCVCGICNEYVGEQLPFTRIHKEREGSSHARLDAPTCKTTRDHSLAGSFDCTTSVCNNNGVLDPSRQKR